MRIALGLEYDGAAFCGWQTQPEGCGVQDHLQRALTQFAAQPVEVIAAGRTDAGVHATAQVVHFDATVERDSNAWVRGTNTYMPPAARVLWAAQVNDSFHARYGAVERTYVYLLVDEPVAPAILHGKVGWFHRPLDVAAMQAATKSLIGEQDFSAFRDAQCQAKSPVRDVREISIAREEGVLRFTFRANAYLHHMIRNIVGSLVYVGAARQEAGWIAELLASKDRKLAAPTFMADGLYLAGVEYDRAFDLPAFRSPPRLALRSP